MPVQAFVSVKELDMAMGKMCIGDLRSATYWHLMSSNN